MTFVSLSILNMNSDSWEKEENFPSWSKLTSSEKKSFSRKKKNDIFPSPKAPINSKKQ